MKNIITLMISISFCYMLNAQATLISMNSNYSNQIFYSMENGEIANISNENWDLAFSLDQYASTIRINDGKGVELYNYHLGDTSQWNSITNAITNNLNAALYNNETNWENGAFDVNSLGHPDYGWGLYNMINHHVIGDSLFIIKTLSGNWKKLWIEELTVVGEYLFKYANLDGSNEMSQSIMKTNYPGKNFIYFSIDQNTIIDREPLANEWDITFTKYISEVQGMPYPVTGVLSNTGIEVAKATGIASPMTYTDYSLHNLESEINIIGYDWKSYQGTYVIDPNQCYFIRDLSQNIWRIVFTSFDGMSTGNIEFNSTLLANNTSVENIKEIKTFEIYPNPTKGNTTLIYDISEKSDIYIYDVSGKSIYKNMLNNNGLSTVSLPTNTLNEGVYFVVISNNKNIFVRKKLIVQ